MTTTMTAAQMQQHIQDRLAREIRELDARSSGYVENSQRKITLIDRAINQLLGLGLGKREARSVINQAKREAVETPVVSRDSFRCPRG